MLYIIDMCKLKLVGIVITYLSNLHKSSRLLDIDAGTVADLFEIF